MRETVVTHEPALLELVLDEVGSDPFERVDEGTAYAQPAILCAGLAAWTGAGRPRPPLHAGHSLGELGALASAGALDPADAVRLAVVRGRLMQEAGEAAPGGMVALLGDAQLAREAAAAGGTVIANDNGPSQLVAAGSPEALDATIAEAKERRVRTLRLAVTAAFHSPAMEPAVAPYREQLERVDFREPQATVISCSTAGAFDSDADAIRDTLAEALVRPVRWRETLDELHRRGARRFAETGPGKTLAGMIKRALDGVEAGSLDWAATVNAWEPAEQRPPALDDA